MEWLKYLYHFGMGAVVMVLGIFFILRSGACNLKNKHNRIWFFGLIGGYIWLAVIYALWISAAIYG